MEVKGTAVKSILDYITTYHSNIKNEWLQKLPVESKEIMENSILVTKWYDMNFGILQPTIVASNLVNKDVNSFSWDTGIFSSQIALTGIYKVFIRVASTDFIISRAANIMETYYKNTSIKVLEKSKNTVTLELLKYPKEYNLIMYRIAGWVQNTFETIGCKNVYIEIKNIEDIYEFKTLIFVKWD